MGMAVPDHTGAHPTQSTARFTVSAPMVYPAHTIIGSLGGPSILPDQVVTISPDSVGYRDLFTSLDPGGGIGRGMYQGTFAAPVTGAMKLGY